MFCESFGGNLFTIDTEEELMTVSDAFTPEDYWIGCRDHNSSMQYLCFWEDMTSLAGNMHHFTDNSSQDERPELLHQQIVRAIFLGQEFYILENSRPRQ